MDKRQGELYKNTVILSLGRFLPKIVSFVTLPILTACLTKAEYGTYDLIDTLIMLLIPIATLQIQSAAFRFLIEQRSNKEESAKIITNIFVVTIPITVIVSVALLFLSPLFMPGLSFGTRSVIALLFLADSMFNASQQVTRGLGGNFDYAVSSVAMAVVNGIGIVLALTVLSSGLFGVVLTLCIAYFVAIIYLWIRKRIYRYIQFGLFSTEEIKELLSYSWPMVPNNLSNWILRLSDRFVITAFLGVSANAVYAVANKIPNLLSLAQSVIVAAWQENASLAVKDKDADKYFTKMFNEMFSLMIGVTAIIIAFTPILFAILIQGDYDEAYNQIPILVLGMFFYAMSSFQGGIYVAHKRTRSVGITTMIAAVINLAVDFALVNAIGITAGSISTLVAYLFLYIYRTYDSLKFQPMDYAIKKQVLCFIVIIIMLLMCFMQLFVLDIINIICGFVVFIVLNRSFIKTIWTRIKESLFSKRLK